MIESIVLNLDFVKTEFGDTPETICEIIEVFREVLETYEQQMSLAISTLDLDLVYLESHKIKPSLKMFGLDGTVFKLEQIEFLAKSLRPMREIEASYHSIQESLPKIHENIRSILTANQ